ncbi:hypothetical protein BCR42DRAFT_390032 [Absidia repens]|uniref:Uncharacterized protein n=1 Tax=Absidia repens TaxID=90262 RepID=A0A1X2IP95_9FUNG|nr:hypothetical protein BCR42DRAFT_390032 [Absidia repens]
MSFYYRYKFISLLWPMCHSIHVDISVKYLRIAGKIGRCLFFRELNISTGFFVNLDFFFMLFTIYLGDVRLNTNEEVFKTHIQFLCFDDGKRHPVRPSQHNLTAWLPIVEQY